MSLKIRSLIAGDGERFSQLYSSQEPWPLFYPTAFIARSIRLSTTHATQLVHLEAIKRALEWADQNNIGLEVRFQRLEFLQPHEIDSLTLFLNAARRGKPGETIGESKGNTYVSYAAQYLKWLAEELITDSYRTEVRNMIDLQHKRLVDKLIPKAGSQSAKRQRILNQHLSEATRTQLEALWIEPFAGLFRSADRGSRLRTIVMLRILYETGMRRGEALSLKLKNVSESTGGMAARLTIERNHHDEFDSRVAQPVAKTEGRIVPITSELEKQLTEYIAQYRADVPGVSFDDESFIFVTHRAGRGQGKPLSISNCDQALTSLKKDFPALLELHFHLLRHDWNYRFSQKADADKMDAEKESEIRNILMGWSLHSQMAVIYNARHVQEQALNIGLKVANATERPAPSIRDGAGASPDTGPLRSQRRTKRS
jgi:integrase